jgi:hypothetical protein
MNFPIPLLALLAARQANDSPADAGRISLKATMIRPPMMGLLVATVIAREAKLFLEDPDVQRALKRLTMKDERRLLQLEDTVSALHRAVDRVRNRPAFDGVARRKGGRVKSRSARARLSGPTTKRAHAASRKRAG